MVVLTYIVSLLILITGVIITDKLFKVIIMEIDNKALSIIAAITTSFIVFLLMVSLIYKLHLIG